MTNHGQLNLRDRTPPRSIYFDEGRFGRLFPSLPPFAENTQDIRKALVELGKQGGLMDAEDPLPTDVDPETDEGFNIIIGGGPKNRDNKSEDACGRLIMTAGMTFLGQFLDHDMTFDPTSSLERQSDPESISNFRTPLLELDSVYGTGPSASPHLYDIHTGRTKFLVEKAVLDDLPRNSQNIALIGDPRNDENLIVSQLHLLFLKFHNAVVDDVMKEWKLSFQDRAALAQKAGKVFAEAQRRVRWHYQWIILYEYLYKTIGEDLVRDILTNGRKFYDWRNEPFIPVEFSVAAFRFGHSQVRPGYLANHGRPNINGGKRFVAPILDINAKAGTKSDSNDLRGGMRAERRFVDWDTFFDFGNDKLKPNKLIDTKLSSVLFRLPFGSPGTPDPGEPNSLAGRNLIRHLTFELPSGQAVARAMGFEPIPMKALENNEIFRSVGLHESTPLWYYILEEADQCQGGTRLGPVGGRIVGEVMIGLIEGDRSSFLRQYPAWKPTLGDGQTFSMRDLIVKAGVLPPGTTADSKPKCPATMLAVDTRPIAENSTSGRKGDRKA